MAIDDNVPNSNVSKNLDAEGKPLYPSTYEFEEIRMIKDVNGLRLTQDIQKIVTSLTIVEELFSPFLTARIRIRDNENFFEDFKLDGQEIVNVKIKYLKKTDSKEATYEFLEHQFVVKDYPTLVKTEESINVQEYDINLVSAWAYLSRVQQISRGVTGNPITIIEDFFKRYLGEPKFEYRSKERMPCQTENFKGVITLRTPLQAIEWLKTLCYDEKGSPYFIYTNLKDNANSRGNTIVAQSLSDILSDEGNEVYNPLEVFGEERVPYRIKPFGDEKPNTPEYLKELKTKIISFASNVKLDKLSQAINGGIGGVTEVVQFTKRKLFRKSVTKTNEIVTMPQSDSTAGQEDFKLSFLNNLEINGKRPEILEKIFEEPRMSQDLFYLPIPPYFKKPEGTTGEDKDKFQGTAEIKEAALRKSKIYMANMESIAHDIVVYGDPNLKAGAKIEIQVPKAVDTNKTEPGIDERLSGNYIIATSVHSFETGVYTNQLKIMRDRY